jgi:hypothetical protein
MLPAPTTQRPRRGIKLAAAVIAVGATAGGVIITLTGSAQADHQHEEHPVGTPVPLPPFTVFTIPPPTLLTIPPFTFVTIPTTDGGATTTTTTTTATTEPTDTTEPAGTTEPADDVVTPTGPQEQYAVNVTAARVECDGRIHVEYDTIAQPQPPLAANHLVVFNPFSNPTDFHVVETQGNPANGSFTFEELGSIEDGYRVFVVADFDPASEAGPVAVDQADVLAAPGC